MAQGKYKVTKTTYKAKGFKVRAAGRTYGAKTRPQATEIINKAKYLESKKISSGRRKSTKPKGFLASLGF